MRSYAACSLSLEDTPLINNKNINFGELTDQSSRAQFYLYETCDVNYEIRVSSMNGGLKHSAQNSVIEYNIKAYSSMGENSSTSALIKPSSGYLILSRNLGSMRTHLQLPETWTPVNYQTTFTIVPSHLKMPTGIYSDELIIEVSYP